MLPMTSFLRLRRPKPLPIQPKLILGTMQRYKYIIGGLEYMAQYIIRLADGQQISLEDATTSQVASAISIIRIKEGHEESDAPIKNP
jgi:hypothetical protein|tara:strand:- start:837 stop:1097 length:261 start_codon:yes stop_codon:yes gene_type:complete